MIKRGDPMNIPFIQKVIPMYIEAAKITLYIGLFGILLSILIGLVCCYISYFKVKGLQRIVKIYVELSRNTPLLIQVFFLYFGLPQMGIKLSGISCGIISLGFLGGSYMAEAFRGGLEAVSTSQIESALSVGLNRRQLIRHIMIPQGFAIAVPQVSANIIFLLKETSILGAIAIPELVFTAKTLIGLYYKTNEALLLLTISYVILILPLSLVFRGIERKLRHGEYGN